MWIWVCITLIGSVDKISPFLPTYTTGGNEDLIFVFKRTRTSTHMVQGDGRSWLESIEKSIEMERTGSLEYLGEGEGDNWGGKVPAEMVIMEGKVLGWFWWWECCWLTLSPSMEGFWISVKRQFQPYMMGNTCELLFSLKKTITWIISGSNVNCTSACWGALNKQ